jgi:hypothetical protein
MMTVRVIAARGQLRIENRSRAQFLASLSADPIDIDAANKRVRAALAGTDVSVSVSTVTPLGRDELAAYWTTVGNVQASGEKSRKTASVFATVLINGLPVSINIIAAGGGGVNGSDLASSVQKYVKLVTARNEPSDDAYQGSHAK